MQEHTPTQESPTIDQLISYYCTSSNGREQELVAALRKVWRENADLVAALEAVEETIDPRLLEYRALTETVKAALARVKEEA